MPAKTTKREKGAFKPMRWTLERAASEFDINPRTLAKQIKKNGILPGTDNKFATIDICRAKYDDYEIERTRKMKEDADAAALANAEARKLVIDRRDFVKRFETIYVSMRQRILGSTLPDADKDAVLSDLARLHTVGNAAGERSAGNVPGDNPGPGEAS